MKFFDRHTCMDENTCKEILSLINTTYQIPNSFLLRNCLYGLFDGYDYSDQINEMLPNLSIPTPVLESIQTVLGKISQYPKRGE